MPIFYPSATVRLVLRFDEGSDTDTLRQNLQNATPPPRKALAMQSFASTATGRRWRDGFADTYISLGP